MWCVARDTTLGLYHRMFVNEWPGFIAVALEASRVLRRSGPKLPECKASMRVVAVAALYEPLVHTMMKGSRELLLDLQMAPVTELRPLILRQELAVFRVMRAVAIRASDVVL